MRVDFVRSASHELRTPLAQLRLFTETLQLGRVRSWSEVQRSLEFVDQQTRRLSRLVENLLTFAHGSERRRAHLEEMDLAEFLTSLFDGFQPIARTLGQNVRLSATDSCTVHADRDWLTQVVLNVLDNATKYGPAGQLVEIRSDAGGRVTIDDQGPGVPFADRRRIFDPFVRLAREHEQRTGGTGIGLSVAADLLTAMNGRISVEDAPTGGARFVIELAMAAPTSPAACVESVVANGTHRSHVA
jgi:signal transduction histidine kinase